MHVFDIPLENSVGCKDSYSLVTLQIRWCNISLEVTKHLSMLTEFRSPSPFQSEPLSRLRAVSPFMVCLLCSTYKLSDTKNRITIFFPTSHTKNHTEQPNFIWIYTFSKNGTKFSHKLHLWTRKNVFFRQLYKMHMPKRQQPKEYLRDLCNS